MTENNSFAHKPQFDVVRIVAVLMIFNFHFCCETHIIKSVFYGYKNGGWGSVGICIFFLLSGYLIHMVSKETGIKKYFFKRFLSIYPSLWLCFLFAYLFISHRRQNLFWGGEKWRLLLSVLGIDTYLQYYQVQSYACVGE